jgi:hypothetical protein
LREEPGRQASGFQALGAITARRGNKCRQGNVHPYGEALGGREDEGGGDAEEGTALGERDMENADPPFHGGGEVAGALESEWMKLGERNCGAGLPSYILGPIKPPPSLEPTEGKWT